MKKQTTPSKQQGFFAVGIGLALLAAFGATGVAIHEVAEGQKEVAMQQEIQEAPRQAFLDH